jgi:hypothetical protein
MRRLPSTVRGVFIYGLANSLSRMPHSRAMRSEMTVALDVDDLKFNGDEYKPSTVAGLARLSREQQSWHREFLIPGRRELMREVDLVSAPTAPLVLRCSEVSRRTLLLPNILTGRERRIACALQEGRQNGYHRSESRWLGYASGTLTHNQDFLSAWPAIREFLSRTPSWRLHVLGPFEFPPDAAAFLESMRIVHTPVRLGENLLQGMSHWDAAIAPLELPSVFNECKSNLKWQHAAALSIPCIASPSMPFQEVILHGEDGLLAGSVEEWSSALALLTDEADRTEMGRQANIRLQGDAFMTSWLLSIELLGNWLTASGATESPGLR